jgi:hypothetical protein
MNIHRAVVYVCAIFCFSNPLYSSDDDLSLRRSNVVVLINGVMFQVPSKEVGQYGTFQEENSNLEKDTQRYSSINKKKFLKSIAFILSVLAAIPHAGPTQNFFESLVEKGASNVWLDVSPVFQIGTCMTHTFITFWAYDELIDSFCESEYKNKKIILFSSIIIGTLGEIGTILTTYFYFKKDFLWPAIKFISTDAFSIKSIFDLQISIKNRNRSSGKEVSESSVLRTTLNVGLSALGIVGLYTHGKITSNFLRRLDLSENLSTVVGVVSTLPSAWIFVEEIPKRAAKIISSSREQGFSRKNLARISAVSSFILVLTSLASPLYSIEDNFEGDSQVAFMATKATEHMVVSSFCCFLLIYKTLDFFIEEKESEYSLPLVNLNRGSIL